MFPQISTLFFLSSFVYLTSTQSVSVLIPSHPVRGFKHSHQKSFGVAYVEFQNEEDAELAKRELNGKVLNDRPLRVKSFVPYAPRASILRRSKSKFGKSKEKPNTTTVHDEINEEKVPETIEETDENAELQEGSNAASDVATPNEEFTEQSSGKSVASDKSTESQKQQPVSEDTVFISRLSPKTTDGDLREFFHEFVPTDVYIFKNRYNKKQHPLRFHQRYVSALVTLTAENGVSQAIETLSCKKIKNKSVVVRAAYLSKIDDVKKAAAVRQKKQEQLEQEAKEAEALALKSEQPTETGHDDSINVVGDEDEEVFEGFDDEKPTTEVQA